MVKYLQCVLRWPSPCANMYVIDNIDLLKESEAWGLERPNSFRLYLKGKELTFRSKPWKTYIRYYN